MQITLHEIRVAELTAGYKENISDNSVVGYGGKLNIRPPYQREFVYKEPQRNAVINTVSKDYPLNVMYWADLGDGTYEVIDGQQRTISICRFVADNFSCTGLFGVDKPLSFGGLKKHEQQKVMNYKLTVYICEGNDREKLEWFKTVNIAGEKLTNQELRNAVYHGPWVTSAKKYFSKQSGRAHAVGGKYMQGSAIRQDYLEHAIKWIGYAKDQSVENHMNAMRKKRNADELRKYFEEVIGWVQDTFPKYNKLMVGPDWGLLYHKYGKQPKTRKGKLQPQVDKLMVDDDVDRKAGIYEYVLSGDEHVLNIRAFTDNQKATAYANQEGRCNNKKCPDADKKFDLDEMQADHIKPWSKGGKTEPANLQMLCRKCNARKSNK